MTAYVVLNGEMTKDMKNIIPEAGDIYCADGGANYLYELGIMPKIIIGDMDSIRPDIKAFYEEKKCAFKTFPREKDETDGELVVDCAMEDVPDEILILCGLGGRLDHTMGNIQLLYRAARKGITGKIIGSGITMIMSNKTISIEKREGQMVSVIPYSDNTVLTLSGFRYDVEKFKFDKGTPIGLSNYLIKDVGEIMVHEGCPLVIVTENIR